MFQGFYTILAKFESSGLLDNDIFFFFYIIVNYCICIKIVIILLVEVVSPTMLRAKPLMDSTIKKIWIS